MQELRRSCSCVVVFLKFDVCSFQICKGSRAWFLAKFGAKTLCLRNKDVVACVIIILFVALPEHEHPLPTISIYNINHPLCSEFIGVLGGFLNDNLLNVPHRTVVNPIVVSEADEVSFFYLFFGDIIIARFLSSHQNVLCTNTTRATSVLLYRILCEVRIFASNFIY